MFTTHTPTLHEIAIIQTSEFYTHNEIQKPTQTIQHTHKYSHTQGVPEKNEMILNLNISKAV